jgi:O-acetylhomoserine/O-acetylserine sulfhydrylase-like pyridoxal-dependent enzyme
MKYPKNDLLAEHKYQKPSEVHFLSPIWRRAVYHFLRRKEQVQNQHPINYKGSYWNRMKNKTLRVLQQKESIQIYLLNLQKITKENME